MKVVVINYSGNVGKTVISQHLLRPRMGNATWIPVESINEGGDKDLNFRGRDFKEVLTEVAASENVVVDVGSSNVEQVFNQLRKLAGSHEDFDFYVVPTVPAEKQQKDTLRVVADLLRLGVDPEKIKIVFNNVPDDAEVKKMFGHTLNGLMDAGIGVNPEAVIHETDLFGGLAPGQTIKDALAMNRDFSKELLAAKTADQKREISSERIWSRMAKSVEAELDHVYDLIFPA